MFSKLISVAAAVATSTVLAVSLLMAPASAGPLSPNFNAAPASSTTLIGFSDRSGKAQLKRLLSPHTNYIAITRAARAATGNPNITVIDRRVGDAVWRCSFVTRHGGRALLCD